MLQQRDTPRAIAGRFARGALAYFVIIGTLGTWLRARFVGFLPLALEPANVIHAHSHVAFFGWANLAMFAGIYYALPRLTGRPLAGAPLIRWQLLLTHAATLGALITFAAGGYSPASIVFSSLNGIVWYAFVWIYWKNTAGLPRPWPVALVYLHAAVALLVLSSLGTWLVAALTASGAGNPLWQAAGLHLFLNNFIDGWLLIGLLGLVTFVLSRPAPPGTGGVDYGDEWAAGPLLWITFLTPLSFLADLIPSGLSFPWTVVGIGARTALAVPYGLFLWRAAKRYRRRAQESRSGRRNDARRTPQDRAASVFFPVATAFFAGKIAAHAGSLTAALAPSRQLFIAYLHLDLLGLFSCGILAVLYALASRRSGPVHGAEIPGGPGAVEPPASLGAASARVLGVGVAGMVLALFAVAAADAVLARDVRATVVELLLQAAFAFAAVSLAGMSAAAIDLSRRWRKDERVPSRF